MPVIKHNPQELFPQYRCYSHAAEIHGESRLLVVSGLNGFHQDGKTMPESFEEQAELIWMHLQAILRSAGMDLHNLVSIRTYLADPKDDEANVRARVKFLGAHEPSLTVVCCQLLDPKW
jgi:2-iminobutanoate/2-iminopropanoate deaminase